jgi:gamma-glutamylcyclotransferase (GGCT)/AIG2-like uncharacterized protein YtfP
MVGGRRAECFLSGWVVENRTETMMNSVRMFVNGEAMRGRPLHHALDEATPLGELRTSARYRLFTIRDEFPGLLPVTEFGTAVPGELYEVSYRALRERLLPNEPRELELSVIELEDGSGALCMQLRSNVIGRPGVFDISDQGGWRNYRKV